ncbi:hypothetical protein N0V88_007310 [Collariella sp. IMI 366227]|nr:hypothetical protein N0V88_007310 [Collariella sp. IMI 366227]
MRPPADENHPEVVPQPSTLPEVVVDQSPEVAPPMFHVETEKYPAYYDTTPKMPHEPGVSPQSHAAPWESRAPGGDDQQTFVGSEPVQEKRILGMRKKIFIIVAAILAVVVIAAAVGGGVGGSMASKKGSDNEAQPAETAPTTSTIPTTTLSTTSQTTTSTAPTPTITFLNNQTDPSIFQRVAFQGFSGPDYSGKATPIYFEEGHVDFSFNVTSYIWLPNGPDCCVSFCQSKVKADGYLCDARRQKETKEPFPRLAIWCGKDRTKWRETCS